MTTTDQESFLQTVRANLRRRSGDPVPEIPSPLSPRRPLGLDEEIEILIHEIELLSGEARRMTSEMIQDSLSSLVERESIKKAVLWSTPYLQSLDLEGALSRFGVEVVPNDSDKKLISECELGITEVDFVLPETGTLCLMAGPAKPKAVSLLPRIHLAVITQDKFRPDIHQVLEESKGEGYLVFISGPSRTSDIELTIALGVHGPQNLVAWVME